MNSEKTLPPAMHAPQLVHLLDSILYLYQIVSYIVTFVEHRYYICYAYYLSYYIVMRSISSIMFALYNTSITTFTMHKNSVD